MGLNKAKNKERDRKRTMNETAKTMNETAKRTMNKNAKNDR